MEKGGVKAYIQMCLYVYKNLRKAANVCFAMVVRGWVHRYSVDREEDQMERGWREVNGYGLTYKVKLYVIDLVTVFVIFYMWMFTFQRKLDKKGGRHLSTYF